MPYYCLGIQISLGLKNTQFAICSKMRIDIARLVLLPEAWSEKSEEAKKEKQGLVYRLCHGLVFLEELNSR